MGPDGMDYDTPKVAIEEDEAFAEQLAKRSAECEERLAALHRETERLERIAAACHVARERLQTKEGLKFTTGINVGANRA